MPFQVPPKTNEEYLIQRIERLENMVTNLRGRHRPTVPIYDFLDQPTDAVEGQIAIMDNAQGVGDIILPRTLAFLANNQSSGSGTTLTSTVTNEEISIGEGIFVMAAAPSVPTLGATPGTPTSCTDSKGNIYSVVSTHKFEAATPAVNEGVRVTWFYAPCTVAMLKTDTITVTWDNTVTDRNMKAFQIRRFGGAAVPRLIAYTADNDTTIRASAQVTLTSPTFTPARDNSSEFGMIAFAQPAGGGLGFGGVGGWSGFFQSGADSGFGGGAHQTYRFNFQSSGANVYMITGPSIITYELDLGKLSGGVSVASFNGIAQNFSTGVNAWKGIMLFVIE